MRKTTHIQKWNYGNYSSNGNYGAHTIAISIGKLTVYISYDTVVAYRVSGEPLQISENVWSRTTGKHLNWIQSNKDARLDNAVFNQQLKETLDRFGLV